jgi:hypothetical protein
VSGPTNSHGTDRFIAAVSAIIAVLAALGTLLAHHRSIAALGVKNDAIVTAAKASDQYTNFETKRVRASMYATLLAADLIIRPDAKRTAQEALNHEQSSSLAVLSDAKALDARVEAEQARSEVLLHSYETLELATTLFEIAIVLTSISALIGSRPLLWISVGSSALGIALLAYGYFQGL